ncbi:3-isopropylmalate dehydratase small subunit [Bordetella genomosp. 8]|uniref:3-isopropylmalate dehydratase n=1 Tax=Bordetella genomosp. 8 TaxID=1416806 RepID=A0A1W6YI42_9BORD|nr:3-isopropylmalate dehydratase small subunit [Bordetella genomosp. 8]ARP80737.1 3-isopropylmalate dehydratase small subunit [Bordetella genomosp. 8]
MRPAVRDIEGVMAVMPMANINTDAIIPSVWLRTATADMGKGLFGGYRYDGQGREQPDFVLNRGPYRHARILLADENFGCGSSREAAVWALTGFGIGCVLAPSFADIFYENAFRNGLVAAIIDGETYRRLRDSASADPAGPAPTCRVDLATATVTGPDGVSRPFTIPASRAQALMRGDDEIAMTMAHLPAIEAHYERMRAASPWLFPAALQRSNAS